MVYYKLCLFSTDGCLEYSVDYSNLSVAEAMNRYRQWVFRGSHYYRGIMYRCTSSCPRWQVLVDDYSWY